jgi:hypothetical protein
MKAFPNGIITNEKGLIIGGQTGMDLRDYFAARALPILMHADTKIWEGHHEIHAEQAYKFADAMMKAREK